MTMRFLAFFLVLVIAVLAMLITFRRIQLSMLLTQYPLIYHTFSICVCQRGCFLNKCSMQGSLVFKKDDKNNLGNSQPILILPVFCKGLQRLFHRCIACSLHKHNIITNTHYGFRQNKSTPLALLDQKKFILQSFEDKNSSGYTVDFTKAFDYIIHILINKLEMYGIYGNALLLI